MLVLRRHQGQSFTIGDAVEVRVLRIGRGYVKVGIIGPREVEVVRTEIARLNQSAVWKASGEWDETLKGLVSRLRLPPKGKSD